MRYIMINRIYLHYFGDFTIRLVCISGIRFDAVDRLLFLLYKKLAVRKLCRQFFYLNITSSNAISPKALTQ